ncbi:hypothetical protein KBD69_04305 [Candidatus Woesebacteria bacterium]|nr:hypothetical protein [Candidatus Woesebacteria bacterium]
MIKSILKNISTYKSQILLITLFLAIQLVYSFKLLYTVAFDPQIGLAQRFAFNLTGGASIEDMISEGIIPQPVDGIFSKQPYIFLLDESGNTTYNTGVFGENVPTIPKKLVVKADWEVNKHIWSPSWDNKQAIAVASYTVEGSNESGFVVVGRDFTETIYRLFEYAIFTLKIWFVIIVAYSITPYLLSKAIKDKRNK